MTLPAWPDDVPPNARDGWQMSSMFLPPTATAMDGGNQRLRAQPGNNVATINYPLTPLTEAQYTSFDTFFRTTLNNGASRFTMTLLIGATSTNKTVQLDTGKSPSVSKQGGLLHITLPLRVYGM
jgi:hypothetical protein